VTLTAAELAEIRRHAEADYPHECCGVVLARGPGEREVFRCRNIQNELHQSDPVKHPRDARTAYYIDPKDLLRIGRREADGFRIEVIYHSHCDVGSYFSETDRRNALLGEEPTYPAATYVVVSVVGRRVVAASAYRWSAAARDFLPVELAEVTA
jgi:adenylyltransferase/sulfurtransferase